MLHLADYVAHLPSGCPLWREAGGPGSLSMEVQALFEVIHGLDVNAWQNTGIMTRKPRGRQPERIAPPPVAREVKAADRRLEAKRERFMQRHRTNAE